MIGEPKMPTGIPRQEKNEESLSYEAIAKLANSGEIVIADVKHIANNPEEGYSTEKIEGIITRNETGLDFNRNGRAEWFKITPELIENGDVVFSKK